MSVKQPSRKSKATLMAKPNTTRTTRENEKKTFSNHEIVTLAVYLLGGESRYVDTEDVAVKANEVAPGHFAWRKYPNQINIENVRTFLSDAKKTKNGAYLLGSGKDGWMLSEKGLGFSVNRIVGLESANLSRTRLTTKEKLQLRSERTRMLASDAFQKYQSSGTSTVTLQEAEAFFRVNDYIVGKARESKIVRIVNTFGSDPELGETVKELAEKVRGRQ